MSSSQDSSNSQANSNSTNACPTEKQQSNTGSHERFELVVCDPRPESQTLVDELATTTPDGKVTACAYHIPLPDSWGALTVRYEEAQNVNAVKTENDIHLVCRPGPPVTTTQAKRQSNTGKQGRCFKMISLL